MKAHTAEMSAIARTSGCEHPIRLRGSVSVVDGTNGAALHEWSSASDEPSGVVHVPCKTRRSSKCASCASLYQRDAYRLVAEGLRGGDYVAESIIENPALFVTFTAPSFGAVHTQRAEKNGKPLACRPRRSGEVCPHGNDLSCSRRHDPNDHLLGQAIAPCCFDYDGAVAWNANAGRLWRATRIAIDRQLARSFGVSVDAMKADLCTTQYVKVAEFQARGLVHFHVAIRLDSIDGAADTEQLVQAVRLAHQQSVVTDQGSHDVRWGEQLDIKVIGANAERAKLAGYFAKYATKDSDAKGLLASRIRSEGQIECLPISDHHARLVRAAWKLGNAHDELNSDQWAHQFGFGSHFLTKSRNWSTTFKVLRERRSDFYADLQRASWQALSPDAQLVIESRWEYAGSGYSSPTEAHLAALHRHRTSSTTHEQAA